MQPERGNRGGEGRLLAVCAAVVAATIGLMMLLDVMPPDRGFETVFVPSVGGAIALSVIAIALHREGRRSLAWRLLLGVPAVAAVALLGASLLIPGGIA